MPLFGRLELATIGTRLPELVGLEAAGWDLPGAEILQLAWEVDDSTLAALPRALHPASPPYVTIVVARFAQSPVGPFHLAHIRLMGRAGAHPRGFVLGAVASNTAAATALIERWGFPARVGTVRLTHYYDRLTAAVIVEGVNILDGGLLNPEPVSGGDLWYVPTITLAGLRQNARLSPTLIQVDSSYTFHRAERGRPAIDSFDGGAWNAPMLRLIEPISASFTVCDTNLGRIRFVFDPQLPAAHGTRRLA